MNAAGLRRPASPRGLRLPPQRRGGLQRRSRRRVTRAVSARARRSPRSPSPSPRRTLCVSEVRGPAPVSASDSAAARGVVVGVGFARVVAPPSAPSGTRRQAGASAAAAPSGSGPRPRPPSVASPARRLGEAPLACSSGFAAAGSCPCRCCASVSSLAGRVGALTGGRPGRAPRLRTGRRRTGRPGSGRGPDGGKRTHRRRGRVEQGPRGPSSARVGRERRAEPRPGSDSARETEAAAPRGPPDVRSARTERGAPRDRPDRRAPPGPASARPPLHARPS